MKTDDCTSPRQCKILGAMLANLFTTKLSPDLCDISYIYLCPGFGLASHLGVLADLPCVGVGKKLYHVDGLQKGPEHRKKVSDMFIVGLQGEKHTV